MDFSGKDFDLAYTFYEIPKNTIELEVKKESKIKKMDDFKMFEIPGYDFNIDVMNKMHYDEYLLDKDDMHKYKPNKKYEKKHDFNEHAYFFEIPGSDFNYEKMNSKLYDAKEGFLRGNMFKEEYEPYKNYGYYHIQPRTEREKKLFRVLEFSFAINDLNLYLDIHPEDMKAYELFKHYVKEEKRACVEYTSMYGPLKITDSNYQTYEWLKNPWPWDNERGVDYV